MKIGVDLDNTIICYDNVFAHVARTLGYDCDGALTKNSIKTWFNNKGMDYKFTEIQGLVYGKYIKHADLFGGVKDCLEAWCKQQHEMYIVSHKTKYPIIGEKIDLRKAAIRYLIDTGIVKQGSIPVENVFFEGTVRSKLIRISKLNLDVFIDDLPAILNANEFPPLTSKILFDPKRKTKEVSNFFMATDWLKIATFIKNKKV